jgi:hypothetical protein
MDYGVGIGFAIQLLQMRNQLMVILDFWKSLISKQGTLRK